MKRIVHTGLMFGFCVVLGACAEKPLFPPDVLEGVAPTFDFVAWREAPPTNPSGKSDSGTKVKLGGRIVQAAIQNGGVLIIAEQLPIVRHPAYGPADSGKRSGEFEFAFLFPGQLESADLRKGNRFILVGTTNGRKPVFVEGAPKTEPYLVAECVHIWRTGDSEISSFPEGVGAGYSPLPEITSCAAKK